MHLRSHLVCGILLLAALLTAVMFDLSPMRGVVHRDTLEITQAQQRQPTPFDLSDLSIPVEEIRGGGPPKDGIPAITNPNTVASAEAKFLKSNDRVIGLILEGQARAYPISILTQHEIVNDTLGGTPVAVTYCPLNVQPDNAIFHVVTPRAYQISTGFFVMRTSCSIARNLSVPTTGTVAFPVCVVSRSVLPEAVNQSV